MDWSDAATYVVLMGTYGLTLDDISGDATTSLGLEKRLEDALKTNSKSLHDEFLRRVNAAAMPPFDGCQ